MRREREDCMVEEKVEVFALFLPRRERGKVKIRARNGR